MFVFNNLLGTLEYHFGLCLLVCCSKDDKQTGIFLCGSTILFSLCYQIWDAYNVKAQTFKTAIEAACMLLRIDDIVSGIKKKQAPGAGGAPKPQIETEGDADGEQILPD